jgi:hypothetical protein
MPATDLKALREYVANVLDYDPTNPTYQAQVDRLLNEADRRICTEKLYTFAQHTAEVRVNADAAAEVTATLGSSNITAATATFFQYMAGQVISIGNVEYEIAWVESTFSAHLTVEWSRPTGTYAANIMHRWIYLPQDCVQVMALARRSDAITPTNPGLLSPISQYEDEWNNLPLGETGLPEVWVPGNPVGVVAPRLGVDLTTTVAVAQGDRTIEVAVVHRRASTLLSSISTIQTIVLTPTQALTVTPPAALDTTTGLYRQVYLRAPLHGLQDWRPALDTVNSEPVVFTPTGTASIGVLSSLSHLQSESYYIEARLISASGTADRLRLYPRQSETMVLQLRYLADYRPMVEDNDTSVIPPAHRMIIAYRALYEVLVKHNNPSLAELYRKRYEAGLLQLERRYLSQPSRRLVKGFMSPAQVPDGPYRRKQLVRL